MRGYQFRFAVRNIKLTEAFVCRVLVGAPLSNVTPSFRSEALVKYGNVFKCEYKPGSSDCSEIVVDYDRK